MPCFLAMIIVHCKAQIVVNVTQINIKLNTTRVTNQKIIGLGLSLKCLLNIFFNCSAIQRVKYKSISSNSLCGETYVPNVSFSGIKPNNLLPPRPLVTLNWFWRCFVNLIQRGSYKLKWKKVSTMFTLTSTK